MFNYRVVVQKYVAPFLMGASLAAVSVFGDVLSFMALLAAGSLWYGSIAVPALR
jgi:hypothetical protein